MRIKILKFLAIVIFVLPILLFLHTGLSLQSLEKDVQVVIFALTFSLIIIWPKYKKYAFLISAALIISMALFYIFNLIDWSDLLGSTGIGIVTLLMLSYFPELVKKGYVEKI